MNLISNPFECCGCTACASSCTHNAIVMKPDRLGFLYPEIDNNKCTDCGLCQRVCAFNDNYDKSLNLDSPIAYAARHKNVLEVMTSRSGAAFIAISDHIIERGGVVYGAGYSEHFRIIHKRAITKDERDEFKGSKYVQSDLNNVFRLVKHDLKSGKIVLFSGTPCQTAGLHSFVGNNLRENLYLLDIVCHGVPSPYVWRDYLTFLENRYKSKISYVNFRDKELYGWKAHKETFKFTTSGAEKISPVFTFYKNIMFRHSCGVCKYTNLQRPSDLTIADFWGWEKIDKHINADDRGLSLVLCNTMKGQLLFDDVKTYMNVIPANLDDCMQPNMEHPTTVHPMRMQFETDYSTRGFEYVFYKYGEEGWRYKLYVSIKRIVKFVKRIIGL